MIKSRKADISGMKFLLYIGYAFLITFAFLLFVGMVSSTTQSFNTIVPEQELSIILERAFTECFGYQDATGRMYDAIDMSRFSDEVLKDCFVFGEYPFDFRFILIYETDEFVYDGSTTPRVRSIRKKETAQTEDWAGKHFELSYEYPVLVHNDKVFVPGTMTIQYQKSQREYDG